VTGVPQADYAPLLSNGSAAELPYVYGVHRPITGLEEFMMKNFDQPRLRFGGFPDSDTIIPVAAMEDFRAAAAYVV